MRLAVAVVLVSVPAVVCWYLSWQLEGYQKEEYQRHLSNFESLLASRYKPEGLPHLRRLRVWLLILAVSWFVVVAVAHP